VIRSMPILAAAAAAVIASAACTNDVVPRAEELAERACACEDAACAEDVNSELEAFLRDATGEKLSERDQDRLRAAANRIGTCIAEQLGAETMGAGDAADRGHSFDPDHDHDHDH
jgi:hypothetical protein